MASVRPETKFKQDLVKQVRDRGGYARRLEDQFAVGLPDLIIIPRDGPVFFVEAKIVRSSNWGPTPRQRLELERINATGAAIGCVVGLRLDGLVDIMEPDGRNKMPGLMDHVGIGGLLIYWRHKCPITAQ